MTNYPQNHLFSKLIVGSSAGDGNELVLAMKLNKIILNERLTKCYDLKLHNAATIYQLAKIFALTSLFESALRYMERCFAIVVETKSFLELDPSLVSKLLDSSELQVTSERQVLHAAYRWLSCGDWRQRMKGAKNILSKVRLGLLFDCERLKPVECGSLSSLQNDRCHAALKEVYRSINATMASQQSRYCSQSEFSVLLCGGCNLRASTERQTEGNVNQFSLPPRMRRLKTFPAMRKSRRSFKAVCLKGDVYVFSGWWPEEEEEVESSSDDAEDEDESSSDDEKEEVVSQKKKRYVLKEIVSVEKYALSTNSWTEVAVMSYRKEYCACAFADQIFIMGGWHSRSTLDSCLQFDTNRTMFKEAARMGARRKEAACAVFKERVVVCGGYDHGILFSAESYDAAEDAWAPMASMTSQRERHALVVVGSKLFAVGGTVDMQSLCETYDDESKKFVPLTSNFEWGRSEMLRFGLFMHRCEALSVANKIFVFQTFDGALAAVYDVSKGEWSWEDITEETECLAHFSCVKLPFY